jgi:Arc/MetJ-type ribon-helix-helix transcriptional regulator
LTQKNIKTENVRAAFPKANVSEKVQITLFLPESYVDLLKRLQTTFGYKNLSSTMDALLRQLIDEHQLPDLRNQYKEPEHLIVRAPEGEELSLYVKEHVLSEKMVNQSYTVSSKYRDKLKFFVEKMQYKSMSELMCELFRKMIK